MAIDVEELRSAGVLPTGPVSAWPKERNMEMVKQASAEKRGPNVAHDTQVKAGAMRMARGLLNTAGQAIMHGKVSQEVRDQRYETCKACPHFIEDTKRCSECGCFMEAKSWIAGNPKKLCPKQKWSR